MRVLRARGPGRRGMAGPGPLWGEGGRLRRTGNPIGRPSRWARRPGLSSSSPLFTTELLVVEACKEASWTPAETATGASLLDWSGSARWGRSKLRRDRERTRGRRSSPKLARVTRGGSPRGNSFSPPLRVARSGGACARSKWTRQPVMGSWRSERLGWLSAARGVWWPKGAGARGSLASEVSRETAVAGNSPSRLDGCLGTRLPGAGGRGGNVRCSASTAELPKGC